MTGRNIEKNHIIFSLYALAIKYCLQVGLMSVITLKGDSILTNIYRWFFILSLVGNAIMFKKIILSVL